MGRGGKRLPHHKALMSAGQFEDENGRPNQKKHKRISLTLKRHPRESGDPICVQASGSLKSRRNAPKLDPRVREDDVIC
jgi:hypothetical protein